MIEKQIKKRFKTWAAFSSYSGEDKTNFKRKIFRNIDRLNIWLIPLNLEIKIIKRKDGL